MALTDGDKKNFATIIDATKNDLITLLECTDTQTKEKVAVLCAVNLVGNDYVFVPLARLFKGNPYDELVPPTQEV